MNILQPHEMPTPPKRNFECLVGAQWVAEALGMPRAQVYDAVSKGHFPQEAIHRIGRRLRFRPEVITAWIEGGCQKRSRCVQ